MPGKIDIGLLCAGEVGQRCVREAMASPVARLRAVFSYRLSDRDPHFERIRALAAEAGAEFVETADVGREEHRDHWNRLQLDYCFAVKWRTMVPARVVSASKGGVIVFHASLLPKYRGFAPINWVLINGEATTGVTMFHAVDAMDAGDIIDQRSLAIAPNETAAELEARVNEMVPRMLADNLPRLADGSATRARQDEHLATYAAWRSDEDSAIDWTRPTHEVHNLIRGLSVEGLGAYTFLGDSRVTVWSATPSPDQATFVGCVPGKVWRVLPNVGVDVLTGDGVLRLLEVQVAGAARKNAASVITKLKTRL